MGKKFSGSLANLFMSNWESKCLQSFPIKPLLWKRYQDDIFGVWPASINSLHHFLDHANNVHPNIRLSLTFGSSVNFLDLTVFFQNGELEHKLYSKPTDSHMLLPPSSHHPRHVFRGVLHGQILRLASTCSRRQDFQNALSLKSSVWKAQGYSFTFIRQTKFKVLNLTQQVSNWHTGTFPCNRPCHACTFVLQRSFIQDSISQNSFPILSHITCDTTKIIYAATCSQGHLYVGQTDQPFRERIAQHIRAMTNNPASRFHEHFRACDSPKNVRFIGIERVLDKDKRLTREQIWIKRLHAILNTQKNKTANKITLSLPYSHCSSRLSNVIRRKCLPLDENLRTAYSRSRNLRELL